VVGAVAVRHLVQVLLVVVLGGLYTQFGYLHGCSMLLFGLRIRHLIDSRRLWHVRDVMCPRCALIDRTWVGDAARCACLTYESTVPTTAAGGNEVKGCGIIGHAGQMAPSIGSLVSPDANRRDRRDTAFIGGPWESDGSLAIGFFDIADIAVERWKAGHRNDALVIPIIYNYRHGIELALRDEIREAAACLREDGATDRGVQAAEVDKVGVGQAFNRATG
jgi:hypothetical protein